MYNRNNTVRAWLTEVDNVGCGESGVSVVDQGEILINLSQKDCFQQMKGKLVPLLPNQVVHGEPVSQHCLYAQRQFLSHNHETQCLFLMKYKPHYL